MVSDGDKDENINNGDGKSIPVTTASNLVTTATTTTTTVAAATTAKAAEAGSVVVVVDGNAVDSSQAIAPPPYSPKRPPPPYALQNAINESIQESANGNTTVDTATTVAGSRAVPTPFTPFSTNTTATVYPSQSNQQITSIGGGINPAVENNVAPPLHCYRPKKAPTAEPHDEYCPKCQCRCRTKQKYISGRLTWLLAFIILLLFFPLAFLPFLIKSCKDVHHFCPKCSMLLSIKRRFFF
uniref:LITAF domain-containing protein n=1 Tax=Syphacia muris TaxID=451379 RepID=A0A0N5ALZ0_9BILA